MACRKGCNLNGKSHKKGGIPVVVGNGDKIEVEGGEVVITKEAVKKHWRELSAINQSGGGVPITRPIDGVAKKGGVVKGAIGASGKQYGYSLKEYEKWGKKQGFFVSPEKYWKSVLGTKYKDFIGRTQSVGERDKPNEMNRYAYKISIGVDLGSKLIPESAKKFARSVYPEFPPPGHVMNAGGNISHSQSINEFRSALSFKKGGLIPEGAKIRMITFDKNEFTRIEAELWLKKNKYKHLINEGVTVWFARQDRVSIRGNIRVKIQKGVTVTYTDKKSSDLL